MIEINNNINNSPALFESPIWLCKGRVGFACVVVSLMARVSHVASILRFARSSPESSFELRDIVELVTIFTDQQNTSGDR